MTEESGVRVADVYVLARDVINRYRQQVTTIPHPIPVLKEQGILQVISGVTGLRIEVCCIPYPGHYLKGWLARYKDHARIIYSTDLNVCWSRFVICKEAFHLLCGDIKNFCIDPVTLVNGLLTSPAFGIDGEQDIERLAVYGAMELLLPSDFDAVLYEAESSGMNHYEIALKFRVPEKIISLRLSPGVRALTDILHRDMH